MPHDGTYKNVLGHKEYWYCDSGELVKNKVVDFEVVMEEQGLGPTLLPPGGTGAGLGPNPGYKPPPSPPPPPPPLPLILPLPLGFTLEKKFRIHISYHFCEIYKPVY